MRDWVNDQYADGRVTVLTDDELDTEIKKMIPGFPSAEALKAAKKIEES